MAEETGQTKTEAPTQRKREEARKQGQVAVSNDLVSGLLLLVGVIVLTMQGGSMAGQLIDVVRWFFLNHSRMELEVLGSQRLAIQLLQQGGELIGTLLGVLFVAGVAVGLVQVGFHITPDLLSFNWERLSPATGWGRLFSMASLVKVVTSLLKIAVMVALAWWVLRGKAAEVVSLGQGTLASAVARAWDITMRLAQAIAGALVLIGVADYAYQRFRLEQSLRMTKEELKEELKHEEGDPHVRARIRRLQREAAQRRMLQQVPKATVVITNPVHFAVALSYDRATMPSPRVVAKGAGHVAERIVELARKNGVIVVERRSLAQALYKTVRLDQEIPPALYHVVAEVLAFVYRLRIGHKI